MSASKYLPDTPLGPCPKCGRKRYLMPSRFRKRGETIEWCLRCTNDERTARGLPIILVGAG